MTARRIVRSFVATIAATSLAGISSLSALAFARVPQGSPTIAPPAATNPSSTPATTPPITVFSCIRADTSWATVARRGPNVTPPMIRWTTTLGNYNPEERCRIVSNRLTRAVAETGGSLRGMMLTYGRVNGSRIVCYVRAKNEGCTQSNILFTLRPGDDPDQVLRRIVAFSVQASGAPVQQSSGSTYVPLGEAVEACLLSPGTCSSGTSPAGAPPSSAPSPEGI